LGSHYEGSREELRALDAFINLVRAADSLTARQAGRVTREGLTLTQFGVLEALFHLGPLSQKVLSQKLLKTSGNTTMVVHNLERGGLITRVRSNSDRRIVTVKLTPRGRGLIRRILPEQIESIRSDMGRLTARELEQLRVMCRKLGKQEE
jgi:MarR family 2-MHQ and catechol resistance regulon transcriptional repressor